MLENDEKDEIHMKWMHIECEAHAGSSNVPIDIGLENSAMEVKDHEIKEVLKMDGVRILLVNEIKSMSIYFLEKISTLSNELLKFKVIRDIESNGGLNKVVVGVPPLRPIPKPPWCEL